MKMVHGGNGSYKKMEKYERFTYRIAGYEYFAFKINNDYAIFVDGCGKFFVAEFYQNYAFISPNYKAYETYNEAEAEIEQRCNNGSICSD